MAGRRVYGGDDGGSISGGSSNHSVLLQNCGGSFASEPLNALFLSGSSSSSSPSLLDCSGVGSRSMMSFEDIRGGNGSNRSFFCPLDSEDNGDEDLDDYFHHPEKKRRLTVDQVRFLEKSFETENKLEPERKVQLAKDLGLQPRQVAIWFQNRRARWKTKQLEKDYEALQSSYGSLKVDYENLLKEKDSLKAEILLLTDKLLHKEKERGNSVLSEVDKFGEELPHNLVADSNLEDEVSKSSKLGCKQEDISSVKSDLCDSDSPHYTDGVHSSLLEPGDSSYIFDPDQSDLSQDEEDNLGRNLLPPYIFPKLEDVDYSDPPTSSCNFVFPIEDNALWSWS
uniref:Homeobox-leucine zipper protein n=1 Tax=Cucumis melo TaxID=3656 RepID=A0A9I9CE08_CUCME